MDTKMSALAIRLCCFILVVSKCLGQGPLFPTPANPSLTKVKRPYIIPVCHEPFFYVEELKKCYLYDDSGTSWTDAKAKCESSGSNLVILETVTERDWVMRYKNGADGNVGIWIGASRASNGSIYWIDGTPFTNFPGCTSMPDQGDYIFLANGGYQCGFLFHPDVLFDYVCEKKLFVD